MIAIQEQNLYAFSNDDADYVQAGNVIQDTNGYPIDLTDKVIHGRASQYKDSIQFYDLVITVTDAVAGIFTLTIPQTFVFPFGINGYNIYMSDAGSPLTNEVLVVFGQFRQATELGIDDIPFSTATPVTSAKSVEFDEAVSGNANVAANIAARHAAATVTDSTEINLTLSGQNLTAQIINDSIVKQKLDDTIRTSLSLADSALQSGNNISELTNDAGYISEISEINWGLIAGTLTDQTDLTTYISDRLATQNTLQKITDGGATTTETITMGGATVDGLLTSNNYVLGLDLSINPVANGQSVVQTYWGMQLSGMTKDNALNYSPDDVGIDRDSYHVVLPMGGNNAARAAAGLAILGTNNQTGNYFEITSDVNKNSLHGDVFAVKADGDVTGAAFIAAGDKVVIATPKTPSSASATGVTGQIAWDADYIYICTSTDTWKRSAISTW
jgi:hypothetical protein